jgi:hypothetical protein
MLLTFANRSLADFTVKYRFFENKLTLIIDTDNAHEVFGKTKITLAGYAVSNIYTDYETVIADFFNSTHEVEAVSTTRLEKTIECYRGFHASADEVEVETLEDPTAEIDFLSQNLEAGRYEFKLINSEDNVFDGALVNFQEKRLGLIDDTYLSGLIDTYAETADEDYESIDNQDLTFNTLTEMSISGESSDTNIFIQVIRK